MRILVTGSRDWSDRIIVEEEIQQFANENPGEPMVVVHGNCPTGADKMADDYALEMYASYSGWEVERHPADWNTHGRAAGPIRNAHMVHLGADICLAFPRPDSKGTWDCIRKAVSAGIPVRIFPERR